MANEYNAPVPTPVPLLATSGRKISSRVLTNLSDVHNRALAEVGAANVVDQAWAENLCRWDDAPKVVGQWRIPTVSDAHNIVQVEAWASSSVAGPGVVEVESAETSDFVTLAPVVGAPDLYSGTLDIGDPAAGYDDLLFTLGNSAGGETKVGAIVVRHLALASPLAAGTLIGGAEPVGLTSQGDDHSLPAATGQIIRAGLEVVIPRRRVLGNWTGLKGISGLSGAVERLPHRYPLVHLVTPHPGARAAGVTYTTWCRVRPHGTDDTYVRVIAVGDFASWPRAVAEEKVSPGGGDTWVELTWELTEDGRIRGYRMPVAFVGVECWTGTPALSPPHLSSAEILSYVSWGE